MTQRIEWIDLCKACAIFAMVFAHCGYRMENSDVQIDHWIHLWHMPVFFILSGTVLNEKKWLGWNTFADFIKSRLKTIILPFLFWGTVCNIWIYVILNYRQMGGDQTTDLSLMLEKYYNFHITTIGATGWFLPAMFLTELLFVVMANMVGTKKKSWSIYLLFVLSAFLFLNYDQIPLPLTLDVVPFTLGFFAFGFLFKQQFVKIEKTSLFCTWLLAGFVIMWYWLPVSANIRVSYYNPEYVAWVVCLLVSCALIWVVKSSEPTIIKFPIYKWIKEIGKSTLIIYLLHGEILRVLPFHKLSLDTTLTTTICQLLISIFVIAILLFVSRFINRFLPWTLGKF